MKILVTGAAGFIGFHTAKQLLERGDTVIGLDNFNDYYDVSLKDARARILRQYDNFEMLRADLQDRNVIENLYRRHAAHSRRLPAQRRTTPGLRVIEFCLRREHHDAVFDSSERRSPAGALWCDQESERADGAHVFEPL
jgi:nucleoside-diphosphate-sugar epimerase